MSTHQNFYIDIVFVDCSTVQFFEVVNFKNIFAVANVLGVDFDLWIDVVAAAVVVAPSVPGDDVGDKMVVAVVPILEVNQALQKSPGKVDLAVHQDLLEAGVGGRVLRPNRWVQFVDHSLAEVDDRIRMSPGEPHPVSVAHLPEFQAHLSARTYEYWSGIVIVAILVEA